jgi:hypothetical protein
MATEVPEIDVRELLALIREGESGPDGYNAINQGTAGDTPGGSEAMLGKPLTGMTVQEVMDQQKGDAFAVGAYQFIPETLARLVKNNNIDTSQPFSEELQNALGTLFLYEFQEFRDLAEGKTTDVGPVMEALSSRGFASLSDLEGNNPLSSVGGNKVTIEPDRFRSALEGMIAPRAVSANVASAGAADPSVSIPEPMKANPYVEREDGNVTISPPDDLAVQFLQARRAKTNDAVMNFLSGGQIAKRQEAEKMRDLQLEQMENKRYQSMIKMINENIENTRKFQVDRQKEVGLTMRKIFGEMGMAERQKGREANDKYLAFFDALAGGGSGVGGLERMDGEAMREAVNEVYKAKSSGSTDLRNIIRDLAVKYDEDSVLAVMKQAQATDSAVFENLGDKLDEVAAVEGETQVAGYSDDVLREYLRGVYGQLPALTNNAGAAFTQIMAANPGQALIHTDKLAQMFEQEGVDAETASKFISMYGGIASGLAAQDLGTALEMAQMTHGITEESLLAEAEGLQIQELNKLALMNAMSSRPDAPEFADLQSAILSHPYFVNMPGTTAQKLKAAAILGRRKLRDTRKAGRGALKEIRQVGSAQAMIPGALEHLVQQGAITQDEADRMQLESRMGDQTVQRAGGGAPLADEEIDMLPEAADVEKDTAPEPTPKPTPTYPEGDATQIAAEAQDVIDSPMPTARGTDPLDLPKVAFGQLNQSRAYKPPEGTTQLTAEQQSHIDVGSRPLTASVNAGFDVPSDQERRIEDFYNAPASMSRAKSRAVQRQMRQIKE